MAPIRIGVIGTGLIWQRVHRGILAELRDQFEPVAFCEIEPERRAAVARDFPAATVVAEPQALLALPQVEVALVLTPIAFNAPTALAALRAGKDVIMEKPIARSVAEGRELVVAAQQAGRRLLVLEQMGYRRAEEVLAHLLRSGAIGEVVLWDRVQHIEPDTAPGPLRYSSTGWRKEANFPLGVLFDGGIHTIAALSQVFGTPATVAATGRKLRAGYGDYDHTYTMFTYENGVTGALSHSTYLPSAQSHFHIYGTAGAIVVEEGRLIVRQDHKPDQVIPLPEENAYQTMWRCLAEAYRQGSEPAYPAEAALRDVNILEAVAQAIRTGARVPVPALDLRSRVT